MKPEADGPMVLLKPEAASCGLLGVRQSRGETGSDLGVYRVLLAQRSPTFLAPGTGFMEDDFFHGWGGDGFRMIQAHYILHCALYFYYHYISSTSDYQALDPRGWGPLL